MRTFSEGDAVTRELMLIKVRYNRDNRRDILENCQLMGANVIDMSSNLMTIQMCDTPERVQIFLDTMKSIRIVELTRTGMVSMVKCSET